MALTITLESGSPLIGSPITFLVKPNSHSSLWTFHRVLLRVYAKLVDPTKADDVDYTSFDFSTPVESTTSVRFDVSTALQSVVDSYQYDTVPPTQYPYVKFRLEAWEEWMIDGRQYESDNKVMHPGIAHSVYEPTNLLTGTATGEGWSNYNGATAEVTQGGLYADSELMSPTITVQADMEYTFLFDTNDTRPSVYIYNIRDDNFDELSVSENENHYIAHFRDVQGDIKMVIRTEEGGLYSNIMLAEGNITDIGEHIDNCYYYAFQGFFTDMERMAVTNGVRSISRFTRKPLTSPEVVFADCEVLRPDTATPAIELMSDYADPETGQFVDSHPTTYPRTISHTIATPSVGLATIGDRQVYAIPRPKDGYELRFVNGFGCLESVHLRCLPTKDVKITTEQYVISRQETFSQFSRGLAVKMGDTEQWKMTTGPLDEAWASWYLHEMLMARWVWIKIDGAWIPCHVLPEETTTLLDSTKAGFIEVQFTLQLDITGSPLSAL